MSLASTLRSPSHVVGDRALTAFVRPPAPPCLARAAPATATKHFNFRSAAPTPLTTLPALELQPQHVLDPIWFNSSFPRHNLPSGYNRHDKEKERKVKLGKTLRILQERLPTLLQTPLPQEILAPNISLHLFPSTYPYLPTVSGRVAYMAAVWTSPIAWNRVPIIGNLKLHILSERMTTEPLDASPRREGAYPEQLVVKWRTADKSQNADKTSLTAQGETKLDDTLRGTQSRGADKAFTGLFIFEFDKDGKVISHTIEHVDQGGEWEKGMGARVVHLTDWLLGGMQGREPQGVFMMQIADNKRKVIDGSKRS